MTSNDECQELAAILVPIPSLDDAATDAEPGDENGSPEVEAAIDAATRDRDELAEALRAMAGHGTDPLLAELSAVYRRKLQAEQEMRLLLAYAREFASSRTYRLIDLAQAAGLSISGVRTAYGYDDVDQVAQVVGRRPSDNRSRSQS